MSVLLASLLAAAAVPTPAAAPSFDCARELTPVEKTICADPALAEADRLLALAYAKAPRSRKMARQQLSWLAVREECTTAGCIEFEYESRTSELIRAIDFPLYYSRTPSENSPSHLYLAPVGGDRYIFQLSALWIYPGGMNANDGGAEGLVRLVGGRGTWTDGECVLTFSRKGKGWAIGQNDGCPQGLNVTLDGYYRA
jgi:uncharacterized protein YecT (DUF1311 family)